MLFTLFTQGFCVSPTEDAKIEPTKETYVQGNLKTILGTILDVLSSSYIRILATVSLISISVKLIIHKDNREFCKKLYGWMIACILVTLAPAIINKVFSIREKAEMIQTFSLFNTPSYTESSN